MRHKNGEKIPVLINSDRNSKTKKYKNRCIVVEMQRRSEYEDKLLLAKKQAEQTSGQKEEILSMMSHELRTPLSVILSMLDLLSDELNGDGLGEHNQYMNLIREASNNLARLADDILNFAKLETGFFDIQTEVILLEEVLIKSYMMLMNDAERKGITIIRAEKTELKVLADSDRLQQVIMNLLKNAIKFTKSGGKIELYTEKESQYVKVHVKDTGIGIPKERIDQIFQPFVRIKQNNLDLQEKGFGLGLPISQKLIRLMGGELTVSSKEGKGSVFTLLLPGVKS